MSTAQGAVPQPNGGDQDVQDKPDLLDYFAERGGRSRQLEEQVAQLQRERDAAQVWPD